MSRATRSKQSNILLSLDLNTKTKRATTKNVAKKKGGNVKPSDKKELKQNENVVPPIKSKESSVKKSESKKLTSLSTVQYTKKNTRLINKDTLLTKKSPVLRDTTNAPSKLSNVKLQLQKKNEISLQENKKEKISIDNKLIKKIKVMVERCIDKRPIIKEADIVNNHSEKSKIEESNERLLKEDNLNKENLIQITKANGLKISKRAKIIVPRINKNNDKESQPQICNKETNSLKSNVVQTRTLRRRKISMEDINKILNEDEESLEVESDKIITTQQKFENLNMIVKNTESTHDDNKKEVQEPEIGTNTAIQDLIPESPHKQKINEVQVNSNKFFKNKRTDSRIKPIINLKRKLPRRVAQNNKKNEIDKVNDNDDSTFILKPLKSNKSLKSVTKTLRPRTNKNYCEMSQLSQNFDFNKKELSKPEKSVDERNQKTIPVYKSIKLSEDIVKDKKEVYEFPDDSQEKIQGVKKQKKSIKRLVKRGKQKIAPQIIVSQEKQKKNIKKKPVTVHFKDQHEHVVNKETIVNIKNVQSYKVPEYLEDAGDSTMQEASTIKILSNTRLEGSQKIDLTVTPPIPKTITSELKLFGPRNAITSQPTSQYSNMMNHSLLRKSMSPISKLDDNFDPGSPWRPIETFSRVKQIVQSTPQTNRLQLLREKKLTLHKINLNKKSISSDDTIHALSAIIDKSSKEEENQKVSTLKKNEISPRKFGTVLSNLSPAQVKNIHNIYNNSPVNNHESNLSSIQSKNSHNIYNTSPVKICKSPLQIESSQTNFSDLPVNREETELVSNMCDKENNNNKTFSSPIKSLKNKFSMPSPFRLDKIHSKKSVSIETQLKPKKSDLQEVNKQTKSEEALGSLENIQPMILRQSNLNNFLNIDEMPEQTCINTIHGIFSDVPSLPKVEKKQKRPFKEPNVENAFGFDDCDTIQLSPVKNPPISVDNFEKEVDNKPQKIVKSILSKIPKKPFRKSVLRSTLKKKNPEEKTIEYFLKNNEKASEETIEKVENKDKPQSIDKSILDSISFSDTFDVLSEQKEIKIPNELPLFVDLQPVHFSEPPRRSYQKRKREVNFDFSLSDEESEISEPDDDEPKRKKKKESKTKQVERKKINDWVKNINETFEEIDNFDLVVE